MRRPRAVALAWFVVFGGGCVRPPAPIESAGRESGEPGKVLAEPTCDLDSPALCIELGLRESVEVIDGNQDFTRASEYFALACEAGAAAGCRQLALLHQDGKLGSAPDPAAALEWFEAACAAAQSGEDAASCTDASALMIADAIADEPKQAQAQRLEARACELGSELGCTRADQLAAAIADRAAKVRGANLAVGEGSVNGFLAHNLECRIEGAPEGLFHNLWPNLTALAQAKNEPKLFAAVAHIGAFASKASAIEQCGAPGVIVEIRWTSRKGKVQTANAEREGSEATCVAKALKRAPVVGLSRNGAPTPTDGECVATLVLGEKASP